MSKLSLCLTSLVAAIPAGILAALMVLTIVAKFNEMPTAYTVLVSIVLAVSAFVAVLPLGILIFGPRRPGEPAADDAAVESAALADAEDSEIGEAFDAETFDEAGDLDDEFATAEIETADEFGEEEFEDWEDEKQ